jgi:hypothetical protein
MWHFEQYRCVKPPFCDQVESSKNLAVASQEPRALSASQWGGGNQELLEPATVVSFPFYDFVS